MKIDTLQQYVNLRRELSQERDELSRRLAKINEALGEISAAAPAEAAPTAAAPVPVAAKVKPGRKPIGIGGSLREHVFAVLQDGPKTKEEVLAAVQKRGYKFSTTNPLNSLGVILYGKSPRFPRVDGRFSLPGGKGAARSTAPAAKAVPVAPAKRKISAAGRKAIAEAARKRWAAAKAAGKSRL